MPDTFSMGFTSSDCVGKASFLMLLWYFQSVTSLAWWHGSLRSLQQNWCWII